VEAFQKEKVRFVFGLPGNPLLLYDDLYDVPEVRPILVRHETSAAFMAYAHGRLTGRPGICHASPGPGVTNLVTGILEAHSGCIPVIAVCPTVNQAKEGMGAFQEVDQVSLMRPITKWATRIPTVEKTPWVMRRAFSLAVGGKPGPVFVEVPADVGLEAGEVPEYVPSEGMVRVAPDPEKVAHVVELLLRSERPVLVAGGGSILSRASGELMAFAELMGIPVLTTASGRGIIPENHPLAFGLVGLYRTKVSKRVLEEADLVIALGTRFEEFASGDFKLLPRGARLVQVDVDPSEIGRNFIADVAVVGDVKLFLAMMLKAMRDKVRKNASDSPRIRELIRAKAAYEAEVESECEVFEGPVRPKMVVRYVNKVFGDNTILANENGGSDLWSYYCPYYRVLNTDDCVPPAEQTAMGLGVCSAIAAKLVKPEKKVVCVTGDGAFQMFMAELATAVQHGAAATWVVLNDFSLGWPKYLTKLKYGGRYIATDFDVSPDFAKVAEATKCFGLRVSDPRDVEPALREAVKANREGVPAVLDFIVKPFDYSPFFEEFHREVWGIGSATG